MQRELCQGFFSRTVSVEVSLGTVLAQLRESVGMHIDLTLLHSCTFVSFVTELLCGLHHSFNAFALAQVASQNRFPFDTLLLSRSFFLLSLFSVFFFKKKKNLACARGCQIERRRLKTRFFFLHFHFKAKSKRDGHTFMSQDTR